MIVKALGRAWFPVGPPRTTRIPIRPALEGGRDACIDRSHPPAGSAKVGSYAALPGSGLAHGRPGILETCALSLVPESRSIPSSQWNPRMICWR